jgi:hypothetical protein
MDKSTEEIVALFNQASAHCDNALRTVKINESLGHINVFGRLAGNFLGYSYTNILAPIWQKRPDLEPFEMRAPYIEPEPALTKESEAALREFIHAARTAIEYTRRSTGNSDSSSIFSFGGLPEVEQAVAEIEAFLAKPRFRDEGLQS